MRSGPPGLGSLCPDDEGRPTGNQADPMPEHNAAPGHRPPGGLAPGSAGGPGLRLGAGLLPAPPPLGLDRAWLTSDARLRGGGPLLLVHGPGDLAAGAPARLVPESLTEPGGPTRAAK